MAERTRNAQKFKDVADRNRHHVEYAIGSAVLMWNEPRSKVGLVSKFLPKWLGPYVVTAKKGPNTYEIKTGENLFETINVDRLRPYHERPEPPVEAKAPAAAVVQVNAPVDMEVDEDKIPTPPLQPSKTVEKTPIEEKRNKKAEKAQELLKSFKQGEIVGVNTKDPKEPYWLAKIEKVLPDNGMCKIFWYEKKQFSNQRPTYQLAYTESAMTRKIVPWDDQVEIQSLLGHSFVLDDDGRIPYAIEDMLVDEIAKAKLFSKRQTKYQAKKQARSLKK